MTNNQMKPTYVDYETPDIRIVGISTGTLICLSDEASSEEYVEESFIWTF